MRKGSCFFVFIIGILLGIVIIKEEPKKFYTKHKETKFIKTHPLTQNAITINNCAEFETQVGEVFLGKSIKSALQTKFSKVSIDYRNNMYPEGKNDEIQIYLRGYFKFTPPFPDYNHLNIAYMIYPIYYTKYDKKILKNRDKIELDNLEYSNIAIDELQFYDVLAVASKSYTKKLQQAGFNAYYVPQFTDTDNFYYEFDETIKSEVLFVGTKRQYGSADMALEYGLPITIYGPNWGDIAKKDYIDNKELHKYYSSAKIVLNDHRGDMKMHGFINNRVYDVTATGTLLISDYMPEIEEIYGDTIPMYKTKEELRDLILYYLSNNEERIKKAKQAQQITLKHYTEKVIGEKFYNIITKEKQKK